MVNIKGLQLFLILSHCGRKKDRKQNRIICCFSNVRNNSLVSIWLRLWWRWSLSANHWDGKQKRDKRSEIDGEKKDGKLKVNAYR